MQLLIDVLGWVGSIEVITAYGLNSYQKLKNDSLWFEVLNLTGGLFLIINTVYYGAFPSTFINVVWVLIALTSLARALNKSN